MLQRRKILATILSVILCGCQSTVNTADIKGSDSEKESIKKYIIKTVYPDGTEYVSVDNGNNWCVDGNISENPIVFIMADDNNEYKLDSLITVKGVNTSSDYMNFSSEILLYYNNYGEWIFDPYKRAQTQTSDSIWPNSKKIINKFHLNADNTIETMAGEYCYEKTFKDDENNTYVCSFVFFVI